MYSSKTDVQSLTAITSKPASIALLLAGLFLLSPGAARSQGGVNPCSSAQPYGDIGKTWQAMQHELGCPLEAETGGTDGFGRSERFRFGQVTWSAPQRGNHAILAAYQAGNAIELQWTGLEPFAYDFFIVRIDKNGQNIAQQDVKGEPSAGWFVARNLTPGATYSFVVEGCKEVGILGRGAKSRCSQGWLNRVFVTMQAGPAKIGPTLPDSPGRGTSCALDPACAVDVVNKAISTGGTIIKLVL